jgi:glutamate synthase domain-containing protein 3
MTGGEVVILGDTGRNFAAGMSGGLAYVFDPGETFVTRCNRGMVDVEPLVDELELLRVHDLVSRHLEFTGSVVAERILRAWPTLSQHFLVVVPRDFRRVRESALGTRVA